MIELGLSDERRKATFRIPEGVSIYAIGDVHGRSDLLDRLFSRIDDDLVANPVPRPIHVFLGDYIDRGPDSYGVLDRLVSELGIDKIFRDAGFEWRNAGCSMCLAMNPDKLAPGERCASTSNRNFEGRQGYKGRTHLVSPAMAAAAAIAGRFVDVREWR